MQWWGRPPTPPYSKSSPRSATPVKVCFATRPDPAVATADCAPRTIAIVIPSDLGNPNR